MAARTFSIDMRLCPFCGAALNQNNPGGNYLYEKGAKAYSCTNNRCDYGGWNLPELFWEKAIEPSSNELQTAYDQFAASLKAERERSDNLFALLKDALDV